MGFRSWILETGQIIVGRPLARLLWPPSSAAVIATREDQLLALEVGDYLMLPGGNSNYGETFEETAKRETLEETGYRVDIKEKIHEGINDLGGVEVFFRAEAGEQVSTGDWEGKPVWIDLESAGERNWRFNRDMEELLDKVDF